MDQKDGAILSLGASLTNRCVNRCRSLIRSSIPLRLSIGLPQVFREQVRGAAKRLPFGVTSRWRWLHSSGCCWSPEAVLQGFCLERACTFSVGMAEIRSLFHDGTNTTEASRKTSYPTMSRGFGSGHSAFSEGSCYHEHAEERNWTEGREEGWDRRASEAPVTRRTEFR